MNLNKVYPSILALVLIGITGTASASHQIRSVAGGFTLSPLPTSVAEASGSLELTYGDWDRSWRIIPVQGNSVMIVSRNDGRCLAVEENHDTGATEIILTKVCAGGYPYKRHWRIEKHENFDAYIIRSYYSKRCLRVPKGDLDFGMAPILSKSSNCIFRRAMWQIKN